MDGINIIAFIAFCLLLLIGVIVSLSAKLITREQAKKILDDHDPKC
jgi:hypothetical protein